MILIPFSPNGVDWVLDNLSAEGVLAGQHEPPHKKSTGKISSPSARGSRQK